MAHGSPGLTIVAASNACEQSAAAQEALELARRTYGRATAIAADSQGADRRLRERADTRGGTVGAGTCTLDAWVADRWAVFGDGRGLVGRASRRALVLTALDRYAGELGAPFSTRGMVSCLESIVKQGAGAPAFEGLDADDPRIDPAEGKLVVLCRAYERLLDERGLIEQGRAASLLPGLMGSAGWTHLVVEGLWSPSDVDVALLAAAAGAAGVTYACKLGEDPAFAAANAAAARLEDACRAKGVGVTRRQAPPRRVDQAPELAALAAHLFHPASEETGPVEPTGAVRFCLPAGRYAEVDLLAGTVKDLVAQGIAPRDIVVACPDPLTCAQQLAGRLGEAAPRGISCRAAGSVPFAGTEAGRLVADLAALAGAADPNAPRPDLRARATDVARNACAGMAPGTANKLDRTWRGMRATSTADYLRDLGAATRPERDGQAGDGGASPLARCIDALLAQDALAAIDAIADGVAGITPWHALQRAALARIRALIESARGLTGADPLSPRSLERLCDGLMVPASLLWVAPGDIAGQEAARVLGSNPNAVRFCTLADVEGLACRALVVCDLTAQSYSVADRPDAASALLSKIGVFVKPGALDSLRWRARAAIESVRDAAVFERCLQDPSAKALRPAALFEEIVDCYRADPSNMDDLDRTTGLPADGRLASTGAGEERFAELASPVTYLPGHTAWPSSGLVPSPRAVAALFAGETPAFSPSAVELYLRCPLRWFYERRLPCDEIDAGFGPLEFGSFCHDVLCRFHRALPELGIARIDGSTPEQAWAPLLDKCFDEALASQGSAQNPLVALGELERRRIESQRRALRDCVARDALLPTGFIPQMHEWSFGLDGSATPAVPYAGVLLRGTIDRVDVDERGRALVIDYKGSVGPGHMCAQQPHGESNSKDAEGCAQDPAWCLHHVPLHSQALMYASALGRAGKGLDPCGALYVSYSSPRAAGFADRPVLGPQVVEKGAYLGEKCALPPDADGSPGMGALMRTTEDVVHEALARLLDGDASPAPRFGKESCSYCSVSGCPGRMS